MPRLEYVADGMHQGIHWHVQRHADGLLVTHVGHVGSASLFWQDDVASASPSDVRGVVEAEIAAVRKRYPELVDREAVF